MERLPEADVYYAHEDISENWMTAIKFCSLKHETHLHLSFSILNSH